MRMPYIRSCLVQLFLDSNFPLLQKYRIPGECWKCAIPIYGPRSQLQKAGAFRWRCYQYANVPFYGHLAVLSVCSVRGEARCRGTQRHQNACSMMVLVGSIALQT